MAHDASQNNPVKESVTALAGIVLLLVIIGGIAVSAWLRPAGEHQPAETAATEAPADATTAHAEILPVALDLTVDETGNALKSCKVQSGAEQAVSDIRTAIAPVFGSDNCQIEVLKAHEEQLTAAKQLPELLGILKGVANAHMTINGTNIHFSVQDNAEATAKLVEAAKAIVPAEYTVDVVVAPVADAAAQPATDAAAQPADAQAEEAKPAETATEAKPEAAAEAQPAADAKPAEATAEAQPATESK